VLTLREGHRVSVPILVSDTVYCASPAFRCAAKVLAREGRGVRGERGEKGWDGRGVRVWGDQEGRGRAEVERPRGGGKRGEGLARATWLRKHSASCKPAASACE
jgi:hypothetical protein